MAWGPKAKGTRTAARTGASRLPGRKALIGHLGRYTWDHGHPQPPRCFSKKNEGFMKGPKGHKPPR